MNVEIYRNYCCMLQ